MVEKVIASTLRSALVLGCLMLCSTAPAHRLDEYLHATLVQIKPDEVRLEINLTPGVAVADEVLGVIDRDRDGVISTNEARAYCELLNRELRLTLDGRKLPLNVASSNFPAPAELRTGWGIIQIALAAKTGSLMSGTHKLTLKDRHLPKLSVYLFNAAQPGSGAIHILRQRRNKEQSVGEIEFRIDH